MSSLLPPEFRAQLHGPARRFFYATLLSSLGNGLILSLNVVYVHIVRHQSVFFATSMLAINAVTGMALSPFVGTLTDKFGPTKIMMGGLLIESAGLVLFGTAATKITILLSSSAMVCGGSAVWGPSSVLLTRLIDVQHRQRAYGLNFMLLNFGIGAGGLISAAVVNLRHPSTFTHLYWATAVMTVATTGVIATVARYGHAAPREGDDATKLGGGWSEVLADRKLRHYIAASLVLLICGYGSIEAGFSLYLIQVAHLSVKFIGVTFFFNTTTIVVGQLFTLRFIEGRSRTKVMVLVGVLWGASWLLVALSVVLPHYVALAVLCLSTSIFALGETFWSPVAPALVNELAPEHLRGRYNAASGLTWSIAGSLAPLITGLFLGAKIGTYWPLFVAGGAVTGGFFATTLRRSITAAQDGVVLPAVA